MNTERLVYFIALAAMSVVIGISLRRRIEGFVLKKYAPEGTDANAFTKDLTAPLSSLLNNVLIPLHFLLFMTPVGTAQPAGQDRAGWFMVCGAAFCFLVWLVLFLLEQAWRAARPASTLYPAAYVTVGSFGGGNRGFIVVFLLSFIPQVVQGFGLPLNLLNYFIAFDAGYYLTFLALFHLIIAGSMGLGSTVHTVKRIVDGQLDFLPPALIVLIAIGGALLKLTGVEFEWLQGIVGPLRTSVGNIMFSVATIYLVVSRPSGLDISPTIGDALALILPRLLAGACLLLMTRQLGLQGIAALSAMQFQLLVLIGVFCILPSSSIVYSLIDRSHADAALKDIVRVQVLKSNLIYLALLLVVMCALALVYAFVPPPAPHG